ncbi:hypothetical protein [Brevibacterium linens]|uniref:hypothetical protein n=1 Tax=Brevibacterium linens TaxID=1703 RepID=UPI003BF58716
MSAKHDADAHLAVVKNFMDGKEARETRRLTRDLAARINPIRLTSALAAVLPHVAKDDDSGNHHVGLVFTYDNVLLLASSGRTSIVAKTPARDGARVTGDVVADAIILTPVMAKQLMGFVGLTPKEAWDPEVELTVTGTGPDKIRIRAIDRTGLFEGKSLTLPVQEPTQNLARTAKILESMAAQISRATRTYAAPAECLELFVTSAKKWGTDFEVDSITDSLWRVTADGLFYGLIASPTITDSNAQAALADDRQKSRSRWFADLTGVGQELVKGFQ